MSAATEEKTGQIDILNTGMGHMEVRFNKEDSIELDRAKRAVSDMLKRGYALFVHEADGKLTRVEKFDSDKGVYIIADVPGDLNASDWPNEFASASVAPKHEQHFDPPTAEDHERVHGSPEPQKKQRGRPRKKEVAMHSTKVTAIGRSAGG